jgi:RHS repeat-associated protein
LLGRQAHFPFGQDFAESGTQEKHHLTSYDRDSESGLDYAVNREYAPTVGRFDKADPYEASGYMVEPQSWNRYSYVGNDPINYDDPVGLFRQGKGAPPPQASPTNPGDPFGDGDGGEGVNKDQPADPGGAGSDWNARLQKALVSLRTNCTEFFGGVDTLAMRAAELVGAPIYFVEATSPHFDDLIPGAPSRGFLRDAWTYRLYWDLNQYGEAKTLTFVEHDEQKWYTVILGESFLNSGDNPGHQDIVLIHEYMHILNEANDIALAHKWKDEGALGLDNIDTIESASNSLTTFIFLDCPHVKKKEKKSH